MHENDRPVCLSIGTSATTGGSGIQADLKTFTALGCYGASVITAACAQSFKGIRGMHVMPDDFVRHQLDAIADDMPIVAVKVGLCPSVGSIRVIGRWLRERPEIKLVVDPVVADSRGIAMLQPETVKAMTGELFPRATIITPNRFQAAILADLDECLGQDAMEEAGRIIFKRYRCPVVISGGGIGEVRDVFVGLDGLSHFNGTGGGRAKVHGRGCTFSAALTAGLAHGDSLREAILNGKLFVAQAMAAASNFAAGYTPLWHGITPVAETIR